MSIKSILIVFGCVWVTIIISLASWHLFKWLVTEGLLIGAVKRVVKLVAISTLMLICLGIYSFIGYYAIKNDRYKDIVSVITDAWRNELGSIKVNDGQDTRIAMD